MWNLYTRIKKAYSKKIVLCIFSLFYFSNFNWTDREQANKSHVPIKAYYYYYYYYYYYFIIIIIIIILYQPFFNRDTEKIKIILFYVNFVCMVNAINTIIFVFLFLCKDTIRLWTGKSETLGK